VPQKADSEEKMDVSMAHLVIAPCISHKLNVLFNNPTEDDKCQCCSCHDDPPPLVLLKLGSAWL